MFVARSSLSYDFERIKLHYIFGQSGRQTQACGKRTFDLTRDDKCSRLANRRRPLLPAAFSNPTAYAIASQEFGVEREKLRALVEVDLKAVEQALDTAGRRGRQEGCQLGSIIGRLHEVVGWST
jgi:hypothetical protein